MSGYNDTTEDSTILATEYSTFSSSFDTSRPRRVTQGELERKQLLHNLELLKLELSQKKLLIATRENEHVNRVEELEEKLSNAIHEKKLLQVQLSSVTAEYQQQLARVQRETQEEIAGIKQRQEEIEGSNPFIADTVRDIKNSLHGALLSDSRYEELTAKGLDKLSLKDFVMVQCYDHCQPHIKLSRKLSTDLKNVEERLLLCEQQNSSTDKKLHKLRSLYDSLERERDSLVDQLADTRSQLTSDQYKIENYDDMKRRLNSTSKELSDVMEQKSELEASLSQCHRENNQLASSLNVVEQKMAILVQDKNYLNKQVDQLYQTKLLAECKIEELTQQLTEARHSKEQLFDRFVNIRETQRMGYESRIQQELQQFHSRTNLGMEQLRVQTREMFERENRGLQEARDAAIIERDKAVSSERETNQQLQELKSLYHQLQTDHNSQLTELQAVVRVKSVEVERTKVLYEEATQNLLHSESQRDQISKKVEALNAELSQLQNDAHKRETELELKLKELSGRVEGYEKVENELDQVILQAAEVCDEADSERVLTSYYGIGVPSAAKRRLQQSVHLARRLLLAERSNVSLKQELAEEKLHCEQLTEQLGRSNRLLDQSKQPHSLLINSVRSCDLQLDKLKKQNHKLQEEIKMLKAERDEMIATHNKMAVDMERLLSQSEDLAAMKQTVLSLCSDKQLPGVASSSTLKQPQPVLFTTNQQTDTCQPSKTSEEITNGGANS